MDVENSSCLITAEGINWTFECVSLTVRVFHGVVMLAIFVASLAGNLTVLLLVYFNKKLQYTSVLASLGLVVADLFTSSIWIFQSEASIIVGMWPFGELGCSIFGYIYLTLIFVRWCEVLAFTTDRFFHIISPFRYDRWAVGLLVAASIVSWLLPAILNLPVLIMQRYSFSPTITVCSVNCGEDTDCSYTVISIFGFFIVGGSVVPTLMYSYIYVYARVKKKKMRRRLTLGRGEGIPQNSNNSSRFHLSLQDRRAITTCLIVFVTFVATNLPLYINSALRRRIEVYTNTPIIVHYISTYIFLLGPVLDPIVVMRNKDFWEVICHIIKVRRTAESHCNGSQRQAVTTSFTSNSDHT